MNKRRKVLQIILSLTTVCFCACTNINMPKTSISKEEKITIIEATDLHYLAQTLFDNGIQFQNTMKAGDGKMPEYSEEILDKLIEDTIELNPSVLILSGDITYNGEKISLQEVAKKLEKVKEAGIPVAVIPGNHDIEYPFAFQYIGENVKPVEGITTKDFEDIMGNFGWNDALSKAPDSMSYTYPVSDDVILMMLDANTKDNPGSITEKTLKWMRKQLSWAQKNNIQTVAVSHQNILKQNSLLYNGFVVSNHDEAADLLKEYGVTLVLSGHSHLQHTSRENGLTDICTESLSVYPLQYGIVTIGSERKQFSYENKELGIRQKESLQRFNEVGRKQILDQFAEMNIEIPETVQEEMISFAGKLNLCYFTGHMENAGSYQYEAGWKDWETYAPDSFFFAYLKSMKDA